jgi:hypothetical protein
VSAEYRSLTGADDDVDIIGSEGGDGGSDDDDGKIKSKGRPGRPTSVNRLIKVRMQRLVEKTDDTCANTFNMGSATNESLTLFHQRSFNDRSLHGASSKKGLPPLL